MNNPVILPTCSSWFDINGIHQIEKDALPEFFTGKQLKTPQAYKNFRNHIIKLYREDPKNYLTATMCRRNIVGCR
jgi:SWI/SNF related-matrix-associated actin-dependent regulator of chromatin subfamily C